MTIKEKPKLRFSGDIIDENTGIIFSMTTNGKTINLLPKYNATGVDLIRFLRFLDNQYKWRLKGETEK